MAKWRIFAVDLLFGKEHDLTKLDNQEKIRWRLEQADFVWTVFDCSHKTHAREIPRKHAGGRAMPSPLCTEKHPGGVLELQGHDKEGMAASNAAAERGLGELMLHQSRGGNSLHWYTPTEVGMLRQGMWGDELHDAGTLQGAGRERQRTRHEAKEMRLWPGMRCRHLHHPQEWKPQVDYSVSAWACRVGGAEMAISRTPPVESTGDRKEWPRIDARVLRGWAMIPRALAAGPDIGEITKKESHGIIPSRHLMGSKKEQTLAADEVYIGHGHYSHGQGASKWASPFTAGQQGAVEECLIMYADYISSSPLAEEIERLVGKRLLSDTPRDMPCTANVLIAMVYYAWRNGSIELPQENAKSGKKVRLTPNNWSRRAISWMTAAIGESWKAVHSGRQGMARQPSLSLERACRWQQQAIIGTSVNFMKEVFGSFQFPYMGNVVKLPVFNRYAEWAEGRGIPPGCSRPPLQVGKIAARAAREAKGVQLGSFSHKTMLPPPVSFSLPPDWRFEEAEAITMARDVGLLTLLSILMFGASYTFGEHLVFGAPGTGHCKWSSVFPRREVPPSEEIAPLGGAAQHNEDLSLSMHPGRGNCVTSEKSIGDANRGFATQPTPREEPVSHLKGEGFRLIRRFVTTQSTDKQRIIDDAITGEQSETSEGGNMLGFCNALQPAHHLAALLSELRAGNMPWPKDGEKGPKGEDWPDAYNTRPCALRNPRRVWWCGGTWREACQCFRGTTSSYVACRTQSPRLIGDPGVPGPW